MTENLLSKKNRLKEDIISNICDIRLPYHFEISVGFLYSFSKKGSIPLFTTDTNDFLEPLTESLLQMARL